MIPALNMHLEDVRVVLKNEINNITVCKDIKEEEPVFYTMISIKNDRYRKHITEQMNQKGMFASCDDFVGSFSVGSELKLLFRYVSDNRIDNVGSIYLYDFVKCRTAALNLASEVAASGITGQVCKLLLEPRNINVNSDCEISLNYFLDFKEYNLDEDVFDDVECIAESVFRILERPWKEKLGGDISHYPDELRLFKMKVQNYSFLSCGQIMTQIRSMPDRPYAKQGLAWRIRKVIRKLKNTFLRNPERVFVTALVVLTIFYAAYQIGIRVRVRRAYERNISYSAMEYIGTVYLGNEE